MELPFTDSAVVVVAAALLFALASIGALVVLWIAAAFSVFGIKGLLKETLREQERTNRLLAELLERGRDNGGSPAEEGGSR